MTKPLRAAMPYTASIIDDFRAHFPAAGIEAAVRAGIAGQPTFHASENGHQIGTRAACDAAKAVSLADIQLTPKNAHKAAARGRGD